MPLALFPKDDPTLRLRLKRQAMGFGSYLMFLLPLGYSVHHGWMAFGYSGLALFVAVALVVNLGFGLAIASGYSRRFRDPGLTLAQIAIAMLLALVLIHYANEARSVLLMLFFSSLFFGVFGLDLRQFLGLSVLAVVGYSTVIGVEHFGTRSDDPALRLELLRLLTLALILAWLSLIGSYAAGLRRALARRNEELATAMARLRVLVSHDELTGAFNRRHLMDILGREKERADRFGHTFSICLLDLDHFKRINDEYGHGAGDAVLRGFAERMLASARKIDWLGRSDEDSTFGRYGGEEFLLVLPHTPLAGARICIERIRARVQETPFATDAGPLVVSFSAGLATHCEGESVAATLHRADEALYQAKANGRNRSEAAETPTAPVAVP